MAQIKKNQLAQIMFPMVDGTDFATVESGLTASDFESKVTKKWFGVNHGTSAAFTSGTISKAATLVRSGIFQQTLKAAETNYDYLVYSFIPNNTSLAQQILIFEAVDYDDSDMYSLLSDIQSDFQSRVPKLVATFSRLSDYHSDLLSYLVGMSGHLSDVESQVDLVATSDYLSQVHSDLRSYLVGMSGHLSDVESQVDLLATSNYLSQVHSDLYSAIGDVGGGTVTASDISDIASAVWAAKYTGHSAASSFGSLMSDIYSLLSDVESQVDLVATSNYLSQVHSDLYSAIGDVGAGTVTASDISDIASAVWAAKYGDHSAASSFGSLMSDIYSLVSNIDSRVPEEPAARSQLSDLASDLRSYLVGISGSLSDVESQVDLLATSNYLSQVHSDLYSAIGDVTAGLDASDISDIASAVWAAKYGDHSAASSFGSLVSDIYSLLSDIESQVDLDASQISDIYSLLSDVESQVDLDAGVISDIYSDLAAGVTIGASSLSDISSRVNAEVLDVLTVDQLADSYAADGAQPTIGQAILAIKQFLEERDVSGTTVTVKKPDGSTTAMTFTLDDGTSPTSITRAT